MTPSLKYLYSRFDSQHKLFLVAYWLLLLTLPFSLAVDLGSFQLQLPSEPLIILLALLLCAIFWRERDLFFQLLRHPLTMAGVCYIAWMELGIAWSTMPLVSVKYWLVTLAHWWVFFMGFAYLMHRMWERGSEGAKDWIPSFMLEWFSGYGLPFVLLMLYAWTVHAQYDFSMDTSLLAARPFYFDHTMYSTCILFLLSLYLAGAWPPSTLSIRQRYWSMGMSLLLVIGFYLSFCRAAWLSGLGVLGLWFLIAVLRFRFWHLLLTLGLVLVLGYFVLHTLQDRLPQNTFESKKGSLSAQILSIGNLTNDVSNLERLNRYSCAWRMAKDRPLTGFGAGTYPFQYLSYQLPEEMTRISVTTAGPHPPGRGGSTHSEYLRALSELGWPGLLAFLAILLLSLYYGIQLYREAHQVAIRYWSLGLLLGLMSFFIHTLFNNFSHTDKVVLFFWSFQAALVVLNQQQKNAAINAK